MNGYKTRGEWRSYRNKKLVARFFDIMEGICRAAIYERDEWIFFLLLKTHHYDLMLPGPQQTPIL